MGKNTPTERAVSAACAIHHANCAAHGLTPDPDSGAVPYLAEIIDRCAGIPSLLAEVERLRAENARLREALEEIVNHEPMGWRTTVTSARAALRGEGE